MQSLADSKNIRVVMLMRDSLYSRMFLGAFLDAVAKIRGSKIEVTGMVLSTSMVARKTSMFHDLLLFLRKAGVGYALYQACLSLLSARLSNQLERIDVPILKTNDVNSEKCVSWLESQSADFFLSYHFNQKMLQSVIDIPKIAALNFHPSYLPTWRGVDPVVFALQQPDSLVGGSIHRVSAEIDEGDVLLREKLGNEHVAGLIGTNEALFTLGGRMAADVISDFDAFDRRRLKQVDLVAMAGWEGRYDGWHNVGHLGLKGLWKALWAKPRKA